MIAALDLFAPEALVLAGVDAQAVSASAAIPARASRAMVGVMRRMVFSHWYPATTPDRRPGWLRLCRRRKAGVRLRGRR